MSAEGEMRAGRLGGIVAMARQALLSSDDRGKARRASIIALFIRVANAVLAYGTQVVLARLMGQFEYGIFAFTWVWLLVFQAIGTFGFGDSPVRFVPALREKGSEAELRGFLRFAFIMSFLTPIAVAALFALAVTQAGPWIESAYVYPLLLMAAVIPFFCLQAYLEDIGRAYFWTVAGLVPVYILRHGFLLVFMLAAVAVGFEANAVTAFACTLLGTALAALWQLVAIWRRLRKVVPPGPRAYRIREWMVGSAPFAVMQGMFHLFSFMSVIVLSFFVGPAQIALFFAATRIMQVVSFIPFAAAVGSAHLFSAAHAAQDQPRLTILTREVSLLTFLASTAATAGVLLLGGWLLALFGEGFAAGYSVLAILAVGVIVRALFGPAEDILNMTGYGYFSAKTYVAMVLVNAALNVALIIPFGIVGAALATTISVTLRSLWLARAAKRLLGLDTTVVGALIFAREFVARWRGTSAQPAE
ncbi:oligosaccharide flippase family protein [Afifella pfennigii]|uniref:oligosaccharide flippase family protein n=1 Tax=Afifella pfennigii TaxID=209897 RepID=UPI0012EBC9B5|nr:polysaccharide biosynthesis C-terminal domain-containing protein [Afifella pfennigii]